MKGGYDLYGTYYPNANDAMNAEIAQCNEIDMRYVKRDIRDLQRMPPQSNEPVPHKDLIHYLCEKIEELEKRILLIENNSK